MVADNILNEITRRLVAGFEPQRIILFGSQARQNAGPMSDIDLLVICQVDNGRRALTTAMDRSLKGLGVARDIVVLTPEEFERDKEVPGTVARPAFLEGRVIYDRAQ